jgi:hydroxycarboxylate dehydrogenase B
LPAIDAVRLERFAATLLKAAGARSDDAEEVARHLVTANLMGHDSHGVGMLPAYVRHVRDGLVDVAARPKLLTDRGAVIQFEGAGAWGAMAGRIAIAAGVERAREFGLVAVTLANAHHLGRIGAFAEQAAARGLVSIHFVNVIDHAPLVAPFGGIQPRLGTNPVCIAFPASDEQPIVLLDMATSRISLGKARVAAARAQKVPFGSILDADGNPTDDPSGVAGFEVQGALTSMGEHKGYGLALVAELLAGVLSGAGTIQPETPRHGGIRNCMTSILLDPARFGRLDWMHAEIARMCAFARSAAPIELDGRVLIPGDPERACYLDRSRNGIPVEPETAGQLEQTAVALGLEIIPWRSSAA